MSEWRDLLGALTAAPDLPGAQCVGLSAAFDPADTGEHRADVEHRHRVALRLCASCPALDRCSTWFDSLPKSKRPTGVVAGRVNQPPHQRKAIA